MTIKDGEPRTAISTFTQLLSSDCQFSVLLYVECCFTSTETVGLLGTGAQSGHLDFHTAPELLSDAWTQPYFCRTVRQWAELSVS